jgi:DNA-binding MarR family transcriptional regulator
MRHRVIIMRDTDEDAGGSGEFQEGREDVLEATAEIIASVAPRFFKLVKARVARDLDAPDDIRELGESQMWVLNALTKGRHQNSELARHYHVTDPTMSRIIDALVRKGYVERRPDMEDRRCTFLEITEQGTGLARHVGEHFHRAIVQFLSPLTEEQLNDILKAHKHIRSLLPETSQDMEQALDAIAGATAGRRRHGPRNPHRDQGLRSYRRGRSSHAERI